MERVTCVPHAKVPIVKFWDPELELACDMNANNTLALENTRMIRTYVEIDERVRPLAMIVKHWTKRRILNDAGKHLPLHIRTTRLTSVALGGTLSSYSWICMILNFLQTRNPPILPSLHGNQSSKSDVLVNGKFAAFNDDLENLRGYGNKNRETLGDLLFQFFRRYAHDLDYEKSVVSVREGRLISKEAKKWHLMQNNRLCVEEPFNVERNLGNTADDISFRGIHLELRRAFDLLSDARLDECLEPYRFPPAEERVYEKPVPKPPPTLTRSRSQSQSSRGKGGFGTRGGRYHANNHHPKGRRASSAAASNKYPMHNGVSLALGPEPPTLTREQAAKAQFEQMKLHKRLFDEMQALQRQEYDLRMKQINNQIITGLELQPTDQLPPNGPHSAREHSRQFQMASPGPLTAPLQGGAQFQQFMYPQVPGTPQQSIHTQPSSPSLRAVQPDLRRGVHRSSGFDSSTANMRSQSQPARAMPVNPNAQNAPPLPVNGPNLLHFQGVRHQQQLMQPDPIYYAAESQGRYRPSETFGYIDQRRHPLQSAFDENVPKEYAGYWINDSPPPSIYREDVRVPRMPQGQDLYPRVRGIPPSFGRLRDESRSPSPSSALPYRDSYRDRSFSLQSTSSAGSRSQRFERVPGTGPPSRGPVIINGTDSFQTPDPPSMVEAASRAATGSEMSRGSEEPIYEQSLPSDVDIYGNGGFEEGFAMEQAAHLYHCHPLPDRSRIDRRGYMDPSSRRVSHQVVDPSASLNMAKLNDRKQGSSRGLNIQFGEVEYTRPPQQKPEPNIPREPSRSSKQVSRIDPPPVAATNGQSEKAASLAPLLSPVREVRTPSPIGRRKEELGSIAKSSGVKPSPLRSSPLKPTPIKMDLRIPSWSDIIKTKQEKARQNEPSEPPAPNVNGSLTPEPKASTSTPVPSPNRLPQSPQKTAAHISPKPATPQPQVNGWQQQTSKKNKKSRSRPGSGQFPGEALPVNEAERKGG